MSQGARPAPPSKALLDRFVPLFVIGRGGMGTVEAAAEHGVAGTRIVALKRLLPHVKDRRHVDMFLREARLAALLDHKNVVHALAYGEHDDELLFAMEYVEGETLASLLERRRALPAEVAAYVVAELCEGLHAAHQLRDVGGGLLGVVHRDVSPHNVMLSYQGDVKLLDFGVAKLQGASQLTRTGEVKGKTAYMSPEQASGDPIDLRSDLYGIGAILFELVAGRRMWAGETDVDFLRQLALAEPLRLEDAAPAALPALCDLHRRLVAKAPGDRPASAREVAEELRKVAGDASKQALVAILAAEFPGEAAAKRRRLDEALTADADVDPRSVEPGGVIAPASPSRPSRTSPWLYAAVGAALAALAVLLVPKRAPAPAPATASSAVAPAPSSHADPLASTAPTSTSVTTPIAAAAQISARPASPPAPRHATPAVTQRPAATAPPASAPAHPPPIDVDPDPI